jgi:hypothetical protein
MSFGAVPSLSSNRPSSYPLALAVLVTVEELIIKGLVIHRRKKFEVANTAVGFCGCFLLKRQITLCV